jgi:hypothetical protein
MLHPGGTPMPMRTRRILGSFSPLSLAKMRTDFEINSLRTGL